MAARSAARRTRRKLPSYDLGPFLIDPGDRATWFGAGPESGT